MNEYCNILDISIIINQIKCNTSYSMNRNTECKVRIYDVKMLENIKL